MNFRMLLFALVVGVLPMVVNAAATVSTNTNTAGHVCQQITSNVSTLMNDSTVTGGENCSGSAYVGYQTKTTGGGLASLQRKMKYCTSCSGTNTLRTVSEVSTDAPNCKITYTTCASASSVTACDGLICEGVILGWEQHPNQETNEMKCDISTNTCSYRCKEGYYADGGMVINGTGCTECPDNASICTIAGSVICEFGHYRKKTTALTKTTYTCPKCPDQDGATASSSGNGTAENDSITSCYIPANSSLTESIGNKYTFTSDCHYTE